MAAEPIALEPVDSVQVTTLVDNVTDILLADTGPAHRAPFTLATEGHVLRAEHGFSCLVEITKGERTTRVLFDAGISTDGLVENMRRLELSPHDIDIDRAQPRALGPHHGMHGLAGELGHRALPVLLHPEFWNRRRVAIPGREAIELPSTSRSALEGAGFAIVEEQQPSFLLDGSLLVTGEVDRTTEFEQGSATTRPTGTGSGSPIP